MPTWLLQRRWFDFRRKTFEECTFRIGEYFLLNLFCCVPGWNIWWWCRSLLRKLSAKSCVRGSKPWAKTLSAYFFWGFDQTEKSKASDEVAYCSDIDGFAVCFCFLIFHDFVTGSERFFLQMLRASNLGGVWVLFCRQGARHRENCAGKKAKNSWSSWLFSDRKNWNLFNCPMRL